MSIKTLRKRIALVAVSALGVGFLSVTPASASIAITALVPDTLYVAVTKDADGTPAVNSGSTALSSSSSTSVGFVNDTSATAQTTDSAAFIYANAGSIRSANVYEGAKLSFAASGSSTSGDGLSVVVTGGTLTNLAATAGTTVTLAAANVSADYKTVVTDEAGTDVIYGLLNVNAAVGSTATISVYTGTNVAGLTTATSGTLVAKYVFTVVSTSSVGYYSAADSTITQQACLANSSSSGNAASNAYDTTTRCRNGYVGVVYVDLEDVYGSEVTAYTLTASASAGNLTYNASATTGDKINAATSGFSGAITGDGEVWIYVGQPTANTAGSSTVTIALNGQTIATKTITWEGDIAKLTIDTANSSANFSTNQADTTANIGAAGVVYVATDAAGNAVTLSSQPSVASATGALIGSTTSTTTNADYAALQTSSVGYGYTMLVIPANALSGKGAYQLQVTNAAGATIKSQVVDVTVSRGSTDSFAISWDKASYNFGDIATLTITAKDAYGNPIADGTTLAGLDLTVSTAGFTAVGAACTSSSVFVGGKKTCKYAALNTEGTYSYSIDLTTATAQSASVGTLPVKPSTSAVSNAEVLAAIVKLIASINKQIAKLQKLIKK